LTNLDDPLQASGSAAIDGLRGLAALMVVASHASLLGLHTVPGLSLAGIGKSGVYLFFVVSAFLLTLQWLRKSPGTPATGRALWHYAVRRFLRIYPLYALVLLAGYLLPAPGLGVPMDGAAFWQHLGLLEGRDIYWSVPVEFKFYLVIPLLAGLLLLPVTAALKGLALVLLVAGALLLYPPASAAGSSIALGVYLPTFLCGSAAAWLMHCGVLRKAPARRCHGYVADVAALALLFVSVPAVLQLLGADARLDLLHREFLGWGIFWSVVLLLVVRGWLPTWGRVLRLSGLRACGRWCFGIYLLHMPALYLAKKLPLPDVTRGWFGLFVALAVAAMAHALVERPATALARRITKPKTS
jgi:peptidoglycan/LPS O-acetylase OafA/YrhL